MHYLYSAFAAGLLSWGLTGLVLAAARGTRRLAPPTDRGLHTAPTPVGGGLGMMAAALTVWLIAVPSLGRLHVVLLAAIAVLATLSWIDDRTPLPPSVRFPVQALVVATLLWSLPDSARIMPALPIGVERALAAVAWLWVINLTNFMDGIDGLAGVEAVAVGAGYVLVNSYWPGEPTLVTSLPELALGVAAAGAGYLVWNWAPARIFMGDVGSIPLGLVFGLLMLDLGMRGHWAAALILPLYFLADATTTLLDRLRRGARPWEAHREHAYQRAVLSGMGHADVSLHVAGLNVVLVALAVLSAAYPVTALLAALLATGALVGWFHARRGSSRPNHRP